MSENPIQPRKGNHGLHVVLSGSGKRSVKVIKRRESQSAPVAHTNKAIGANNGSADGASAKEANDLASPGFAKVYPAWQGYWIEFKLRKVYHPISTRRIGYPREQPEEIRQARRKLWERMVPNSSSLTLDLLEGVEINTATLDEIRYILAGKWNQTTNNFENRWRWFRRRLGEIGLSELEIRLVLGIESAGNPAECADVDQEKDESAIVTPRPTLTPQIHSSRGRVESAAGNNDVPAAPWGRPSPLARLLLGPKVEDYRWFMNVIRAAWPGPDLRSRQFGSPERRDHLTRLGLSDEQIEALACVWPNQLRETPRQSRTDRKPCSERMN